MSITYPRTQEEWTEHNRQADEEYERLHGVDSHDCKLEPICTGDPECQFAQCPNCGFPNIRCQCDAIYDRYHDK